MPKIVLSTDKTTWIGFELYPGNQYISFDEVKFTIPQSDIILEPTADQICDDLLMLFDVNVLTSNVIFKELCYLLCEQRYTGGQCIYFKNYNAKYGVSKCLNPDVKYVVK